MKVVSSLALCRREEGQSKITIRTKSDQNKIAISLKLVPSLALYRREEDQSKMTIRTKSDQIMIAIRLKLVPYIAPDKEIRSK